MYIACASQHSVTTFGTVLILKIISNYKFLEEIYIDSSFKEKQIESDDIIGFKEIINGKPNLFFDIDYEQHKSLLNPEKIRINNIGLNLFKNKHLSTFIIENHLDTGHKDTVLLDFLNRLIQDCNPIPYTTLKEIVGNYKIYYLESGYDKPGDWSIASISIKTNNTTFFQFHSKSIRSSVFGDVFGYKDDYLSTLFPSFNFTLGSGKDDIDSLFKSQIIEGLKNDIGEGKLEEIKNMCDTLTINIKNMATLAYNKDAHLSFVKNLYEKLKAELYLKLK